MIAIATKNPTVVFAMTYPDSEGNVWSRIVRLYDLVALELRKQGVTSIVTYPKLTDTPAYRAQHMTPVEMDLRRFDSRQAEAIEDLLVGRGVGAIVYMDMDTGDVWFSLLRRLGVRTINFNQYNFADDCSPSPVRRLANAVRGWLGIRHHDVYVANSIHQEHLMVEHLGIPRSRLRTAVNGIDAKLFSPVDSSQRPDPARWGLPLTAYYAIIVCQSRPEKRVDFLIDVAERVFQKRPDLSLTFIYAGSGGRLEAWKEHAQRKGLGERFSFLGQTSDLTPLYRRADMMLHAPSRESFGYVLTEAMACCLPVLCTNVGGPREIIADGATGYLLPVDGLDAFADHIIRWIDEPETMRAMGQAGRQRVLDHFLIDRQVDDFARIVSDQLVTTA